LEDKYDLAYQELAYQSEDHFTEQDVGFLFRAPVDVLSTMQFMQTQAMHDTNRYYNVPKHLVGVFQFPTGDNQEQIIIMNVHLRSRPEGEQVRIKQARLVHHWLANMIARGENVILLGDTNSEEKGDTMREGSDLAILCGRETETTRDDLYDLHLRLSREERQTHLLPDRQFDRIFVSKPMLEDDPSRPDLVFESIEVLRNLSVQGELDVPDLHWDQYWQLPSDQRDLSDHFPVRATFRVR
jgi:endonuclease/exonuclease/phosphatase family metal-dependent hydrolase